MSDALENFDYNQEPENYCEEPTNAEIDNFDNYSKRVSKFKSSLMNPHDIDNSESFFYSILYGLRYHLTGKAEPCSEDEEIKADVTAEIFDQLNLKRDKIKLDLDLMNFENQCFLINRNVMNKNLFLRVYELKDKFRYLIKEDSKKKHVLRDFSSCIIEKFNGFNIVRLEIDRELRNEMSTLDIVYKPVRKHTDNIECFFTTQLNLAFRKSFSEGDKTRHGTAFQCFYCSKYFARKNMWERHLQSCMGLPGFVCSFNTRSLLTFEENLKYKCDVPLTAYIDFATTAPPTTAPTPKIAKCMLFHMQ